MKQGLSEQLIRSRLDDGVRAEIDRLHVVESIGSTNDYVMTELDHRKAGFVACIADQQTAGRGRNGREWLSPANANIYMSLGFYLNRAMLRQISGLSLACGVSIAIELEKLGISPMVKWPNDVMLDGKKLAGILIESRIKADMVQVVVGVGLNVSMPQDIMKNIDRPWTDLETALAGTGASLERNEIAAHMLNALLDCCSEYNATGFAQFRKQWQRLDMLKGAEVILCSDAQETEQGAKVLGLDESFGLKVDVSGVEKVVHAADIKLKLQKHVNN